ncbi:glycosyltransferase [Pseudomonas sp. FW305-17]|uniref:glycosyltransferase family 2 protein n=1 Tax=Pseudomonas sp. FW305-17 TaxID=2070681 RepID=UPI00130497E0|nr:glycosyltransferase [Pseudomonas sp. FW305-17]
MSRVLDLPCGGESEKLVKGLVSVCIPVYNHQRYVEQCVRSILEQDYSRIELIVIDDGSPDESCQVIKQLITECEARFERFEFRSRPNKGLSNTLNEGLAWSRGEYFCVIASDDAMLPDKTTKLLAHLEEDATFAGAFGGIMMMDDDGKIVGQVNPGSRDCCFADIFLAKVKLLAPANLLRTEVVRRMGGFNPQVKVEDWDLWLRMTHGGERLRIVGEVVSLYRRHDSNTSKNYALMQNEMAKIASAYRLHPLYASNQSMLHCMKFRDHAMVAKLQAVKMLPSVCWRVGDVRMWQGLFNLLFKW